MKTKRGWVRKDAIVPFTFQRGQCFLCPAEAVTKMAGEPVCAAHLTKVLAIVASAPAPERERERVA